MRPHFRTWDWALPAWVTGWIQFRSAGKWSVFSASFLVGAGRVCWFSHLPGLQSLLSPVGFLQFGWNTSPQTGGWGYPWFPLHRFQAGLARLPELTRLVANPSKPHFLGSRGAHEGQMQQAQGQTMSLWQGSSTWWCLLLLPLLRHTLLMHGPIPWWGSPNPVVRAPGLWCGLGGGQHCPLCSPWPLGPASQPPLKPAAPTGPDSDVVTVIMDGWLFPQS